MSEGTGPQILVVEDDQAIRETLRDLLELEGYNVHEAANGQIAIDLLQQGVVKPSLILLDLMMPIFTGWEVLQKLKEPEMAAFSQIPVVIVSAAADAAESAKRQASGFIKKPVDMDVFLGVLRQHCPLSS